VILEMLIISKIINKQKEDRKNVGLSCAGQVWHRVLRNT